MKRYKVSRRNSGQVLVVAALAIAVIICSTTVYVYETARSTNNSYPTFLNEFVLAIRHGTKNVLVSSLANVTVGGEKGVLISNLENWCSLVERRYVFGKSLLSYSLSNSSPYTEGFCINWTANGYGVSSVSTNFTLKIRGKKVTMDVPYQTVVALTLIVNGTSEPIGGQTRVNVTLVLSNEDTYALARNMTLYYRNGTTWIQASSSNDLIVVDYGNGTYRSSFTAPISSENVEISTRIFDKREILVVANATCSSI